jgi:small redox-active disulfide protein 2
MIVKILGSGCKKCLALEANTKEALRASGIAAEVEKVTDIVVMASYGIMSTPGLVVDEKVISTGRVLSALEIEALLKAS